MCELKKRARPVLVSRCQTESLSAVESSSKNSKRKGSESGKAESSKRMKRMHSNLLLKQRRDRYKKKRGAKQLLINAGIRAAVSVQEEGLVERLNQKKKEREEEVKRAREKQRNLVDRNNRIRQYYASQSGLSATATTTTVPVAVIDVSTTHVLAIGSIR